MDEVNNQYASQELRKDNYDRKIKEFTIAAATHFNEQVSRDLANIGLASPTPSVRSVRLNVLCFGIGPCQFS